MGVIVIVTAAALATDDLHRRGPWWNAAARASPRKHLLRVVNAGPAGNRLARAVTGWRRP